LSEAFNQLRFDISETVRLHPQQSGIGSLLDLDLYPEVEILDKGKHLKIQGYLRLKGNYLIDAGEQELELEESNQEELSYIIPVEITLPADRAELDNLSAEVESFDYTVLSPFELQIEAILAIDGLLPEQKAVADEEITLGPTFSGAEVRAADDEAMTEGEDFDPGSSFEAPEYEAQPADMVEQEKGSVVEQKLAEESLSPPAEEPTWEADENQASEKTAEVEEEQTEELDDETEGKWSSWLLTDKEEQWTPLKMAIVQKEDSLTSIANRYGVAPSQLLQLNQLAENQLEVGQIVYLPSSAGERSTHCNQE
jgi:LysM repeat protein